MFFFPYIPSMSKLQNVLTIIQNVHQMYSIYNINIVFLIVNDNYIINVLINVYLRIKAKPKYIWYVVLSVILYNV